ncbi:MAG: CARDB domain-containing protein [Flammeovirgaceae bacterium]
MKQVYLFLMLLFISGYALAQDAKISEKSSTSSASIGDRITIRTDLTNAGSVSTPAFYMYYYINKVNHLDGNQIPLNSNGESGFNLDWVRAMSPGGDDDENHYPDIPDNLITGNYYIIWHLDVNDANQSNNVVAAPIYINGIDPEPDLVVTNANVPSGSINAGSSISVSARVRNQGTAAAGASTLKYWISSNTSLGAGDVELATDAVGSLAAGATSSTESASLSLPANRTGTQYILFQADGGNSVSESNENNNIAHKQITIGTPLPDLLVDYSNVSVSPAYDNVFIQWPTNLLNQGDANVNTYTQMDVYLSTNSSLDIFNDFYLGDSFVNSINAGQSKQMVTAGGGRTVWDYELGEGTYYVIGYVDYTDAIEESNENNNVSILGQITIDYLRSRPCCGIIKPIDPIGPILQRSAQAGNPSPSRTLIGPNPTKGMLNLTFGGKTSGEALNITITTVEGKQIFSKQVAGMNALTVDLTAQPNGVYLLIEETTTGKVVQRIVKE